MITMYTGPKDFILRGAIQIDSIISDAPFTIKPTVGSIVIVTYQLDWRYGSKVPKVEVSYINKDKKKISTKTTFTKLYNMLDHFEWHQVKNYQFED